MLYHSTRNADLTAPSTHAVLEGIAPTAACISVIPPSCTLTGRAL